MSPPRLTRAGSPSSCSRPAATTSAAQAFAVEPRSSAVPAGMRIAGLVELDRPPGIDRRRGRVRRRGLDLPELAEVPVVAERHQRPAQQRVHQPVRGGCGPDRDPHRLDQQRVDVHPPARLAVHPSEVGVRPEPAARRVDVPDHGLRDAQGARERRRRGVRRGSRRSRRPRTRHDWTGRGWTSGPAARCRRRLRRRVPAPVRVPARVPSCGCRCCRCCRCAGHGATGPGSLLLRVPPVTYGWSPGSRGAARAAGTRGAAARRSARRCALSWACWAAAWSASCSSCSWAASPAAMPISPPVRVRAPRPATPVTPVTTCR